MERFIKIIFIEKLHKMNRTIEVKGEGQIESANVVQSFLGKNLLELKLKEGASRKIPIRERRALTVLQNNGENYLLSIQSLGGYGGYASIGYFIEENLTSKRFLHPEPKPILNVSYFTTDSGQAILDNFYDGNKNISSIVFRHPSVTTGHNHSFCVEYMPIGVLDLKSREKKIIAQKARNIHTITQNNGNILIGATIPASIIPSLIKESRAGVLEDVFDKKDMEKVAQLNERNDKNHMCFGNSSCIPRSMFEFAELKGYPKYKLGMDTTGRIYTAERVFE